MRFHLDVSRRYAEANAVPLVDAARLLGRLKAAMGHRFYAAISVETAAGDISNALRSESVYRDGLDRGFGGVFDGFRDLLWGTAWAEAQEERGESFSGMNVLDVMPEAPLEAECETAFLLGRVEGDARRAIDQLWDDALESAVAAGLEDHRNLTEERFGNCLYWEMTGAGSGWSDDFPAYREGRVPYADVSLDCALDGDHALGRNQAVEIAHSYASMVDAGDPGIILYAFASTGGTIENEEGRSRLLAYLRGSILDAARANDVDGDCTPVHGDTEVEDIEALIHFVDNLEVPAPELRPLSP